MIPLKDNIPSRTVPYVGYAMIALCCLTFAAQLSVGDGRLIEQFGMVPVRVRHPQQPVEIVSRIPILLPGGIYAEGEQRRELAPAAVLPQLTMVSCIFLHGGWMHILGNLWFLFIFGDNVEDRFGHVGFAVLYMGCGVAASAAHLLVNPDSPVPTIGASGAIAGIMGAYFVLYPRAQVLALIPIVILFYVVVLPAPLFLGIWFSIQFLQGVGSISGMEAGVAWWAHIGGFLIGALAALALKDGPLQPAVQQVRTYESGTYGIYRK